MTDTTTISTISKMTECQTADQDQQLIDTDTLVYQMERKYFCNCAEEEEEDKEKKEKQADEDNYIIDIFGSSPFQFGSSPLVAAHEQVLELLVLDHLAIRHVGPIDRFAALAKNVTELVLCGNQLGWHAVAQLMGALPHLRALNLAQNEPLNEPMPEGMEMPKAGKLDVLILNGLRSLSFSTLRSLLSSCPNLHELHLAKCTFAAISAPFLGPISLGLRELHLNECQLDDWCQVLAILAHFPRLNSLFLTDNPIDTVDTVCPCGNETETLCSEMNALSLSNTRLSSWEAIESLESVGKGRLQELRVAHVPLMDQYSEEERRHLVIGRLRSLKVLNGSKIEPRQREESERFFIRYYAEAEKKPLIYDQLVAEHGMLEQLVKVDLTPKRFAKVIIHCDETDWSRTWVRLRLCGTVLGLMKFAEKLTNIPMRLMRLFYLDKSVLGPTELRTPNKQLRLLHIEDGDEFVVQSKLVYTPKTVPDQSDQITD